MDAKTNDARDISQLIRDTYGGKIKVYGTDIPRSVRAAEISAEGKSIFAHDPKGKVAEVPVIVRDMDDDPATVLMVDSNLQREQILPSERAFAYKMKLEAM